MGTVFKVKIRKIGTSLGVLIPKQIIDEGSLKVGEEVEIDILKRRKDLIDRALGMARGAKPFVREYEEDRDR